MTRVRMVLLAALLIVVAVAWPGSPSASAESWTLDTAQRQASLSYYAPVILKRGDENNGREGADWLSNYDFDRDGDFSTNRVDWRDVGQYAMAGAHRDWRIRDRERNTLNHSHTEISRLAAF